MLSDSRALWGNYSVPLSSGFCLLLALVYSVVAPEPFLALVFCTPAFLEKQLSCCTNPDVSVLVPSGILKRLCLLVYTECCSEQATRRTAGQMFEPVGMCCKAGKGRNHSAWNVLGCHLHVEEQPRVTEFFSVKNRDGGAGNLRDHRAESL